MLSRTRTAIAATDDAPSPDDIAPVDSLPAGPWALIWSTGRERFRGRLMLLVGAAALAQGIEALAPFALSRLVQALSGAAPDAAAAWTGFALLVAIWVGQTLFARLYEYTEIRTSPSFRALVQRRLLGYLLGHAPRFFQDNFAGKLGQKIKQASQASIQVVSICCHEVTRIVTLILVGGVLLGLAEPGYALVLLVWAALYLGASALLARRCVRLSRGFAEAWATTTGRIVDVLANADVVRAFVKRLHERRHVGAYIDAEAEASRRFRAFLLVMHAVQAAAMVAFAAVLVAMALSDALAGRMTVGLFAMVFTLGTMIALQVANLSNRMLEFFEQTGVIVETLELVGEPHEIRDRPGARPLAVRAGAIAVEHVAFAHPDGKPVFRDLSLAIRAGERIGLVGPSGAGKSTLVKLLRRHFEPQAGRILIDGQDIAAVTWDSLNEAIAEVPQSPGVFHRSIADNIRYARPDAPLAEVVRAAELAHCHDFVAERPTGYDTIVGEQGIKLSGGERQRVAIARALVKDAPILVLDEATSSLDSESEHLIQEALWRLMQGRTVIAIAHRLSTVTAMDRILYLRDGVIVEQGSHAELLARGGAYARMWHRQAGGFLAA